MTWLQGSQMTRLKSLFEPEVPLWHLDCHHAGYYVQQQCCPFGLQRSPRKVPWSGNWGSSNSGCSSAGWWPPGRLSGKVYIVNDNWKAWVGESCENTLFLFKVKMRCLKEGVLSCYYLCVWYWITFLDLWQTCFSKAVQLRNDHFRNWRFGFSTAVFFYFIFLIYLK